MFGFKEALLAVTISKLPSFVLHYLERLQMHQPFLIQIIIFESRARNEIPSTINKPGIHGVEKMHMYRDTIVFVHVTQYIRISLLLRSRI